MSMSRLLEVKKITTDFKPYNFSKPIVQQPYFGYQQYFTRRLSADLTAVNTHMTTEGYYVRNTLWADLT